MQNCSKSGVLCGIRAEHIPVPSPKLIRQLQLGLTETYANIFTDNSFMIKHGCVSHSPLTSGEFGSVKFVVGLRQTTLLCSRFESIGSLDPPYVRFPKQTPLARVVAAISIEVKTYRSELKLAPEQRPYFGTTSIPLAEFCLSPIGRLNLVYRRLAG